MVTVTAPEKLLTKTLNNDIGVSMTTRIYTRSSSIAVHRIMERRERRCTELVVIGSNESGFASCVEKGFKDCKEMIIVRDANQL